MANENSVYSYEANFIAALETILDIALTQTVAFGDNTTHQTPRIKVGFTYGGADQTDRALTADGKLYLRKHTGTINLTVSGIVKADHLALVGQVRNFMAWNVPTLINPVLAYYQVQSVFEQGGNNEAGEEEGDFEIETELSFDVVYQIPPVAFGGFTNFAITDGIASFVNIGDISAGGSVAKIIATLRSSADSNIYIQLSGFSSAILTINPNGTWQETEWTTITPFPASLLKFGVNNLSGFSENDWSDVRLYDELDVLIAQYQLNEQASGSLDGVTAVDSSGNGYDGVYVGCTGGSTPDL